MTTNNSSREIPADSDVQDHAELLEAGLAASRGHDFDRARHFFARASIAAPGSAIPHFLLGSEYAAAGEIHKAEAALANAVLLAPALHIARYQLGMLQFSAGRAAVALVTWAPLLELDELQPLVHYVRGFYSLAQDDFENACAQFEAGLALPQDNPAVASDVRKVMAGMAAVQPAGEAQGPATANRDRADEPAAHVLVSNYGKFGSLH
jgi:tetratricopeptide (TPR) repeat protein